MSGEKREGAEAPNESWDEKLKRENRYTTEEEEGRLVRKKDKRVSR